MNKNPRDLLRLIVSSPDGEILNKDQVDWINLKLSGGTPISIYPRHAPLIALTSACILKYRIRENVFEENIPQGILSISENTVKCWVKIDSAEDENKEISKSI